MPGRCAFAGRRSRNAHQKQESPTARVLRANFQRGRATNHDVPAYDVRAAWLGAGRRDVAGITPQARQVVACSGSGDRDGSRSIYSWRTKASTWRRALPGLRGRTAPFTAAYWETAADVYGEMARQPDHGDGMAASRQRWPCSN